MAITDSWLRSVNGRPQQKMLTKSDRDGLSVRVTPLGKVVFQFRYRWDNKGERIDIGTYPATGLKEARDSAVFYRGEIEQHRNPKVVKRVKKQEAITSCTVEMVIREWWEKAVKKSQVRADELLRSFEIYVFPKIGMLPHNDTHLHVWLSLLEDVSKNKPTIAARILRYAKTAHRWGIRRGIITANPLSDLSPVDLGVKNKQGDRVLSDDEISQLFRLIDDKKYNPRNRLIIKLALLFGCRIGELLKAKITDFDFDSGVWTVPPENHKTGNRSNKPLIRPIIEPAKAMIFDAISMSGGIYLFTTSDGSQMIEGSQGSIMQILNKKMAAHYDDYKTWSIHDLRKTMRTGVSELTMPHVAEIMLGHKLPGVWQVYDKHTYLDEQREAYEKWWDKVIRVAYRQPMP
ncbi:tyrosine-type recombinase/integrase [Morganella morganii]|uniref:tyrosine-type recombinase/integrase n=1 Tax=Morganella morganii TaxID=582 RepID=UPI001C8B7548|nr:site-specific integrase [Morganella morganii]MBX9343564.1 tyrosine-type recombinase/integrase [Morganella morganii]MBX9369745.1 tyrosine-type recombinase/integrase [Morganella morganii]